MLDTKNTKGRYVGCIVIILEDTLKKGREHKIGIVRHYEMKNTIGGLLLQLSGEKKEFSEGNFAGTPAIELDDGVFIRGDECYWADLEEVKGILRGECINKSGCREDCTEDELKKCRERVVGVFQESLQRSSEHIKREAGRIIGEIQELISTAS